MRNPMWEGQNVPTNKQNGLLWPKFYILENIKHVKGLKGPRSKPQGGPRLVIFGGYYLLLYHESGTLLDSHEPGKGQ